MASSAKHRQLFYFELAKLVEAGFGIREAAKTMLATGVPAEQAAWLHRMEAGLDSGKSITSAFSEGSSEISDLERTLLGAGERSGKLGPAFQHLSDYFDMVAKGRGVAVRAMIYPLVLLHLGIFISIVPQALMASQTVTATLLSLLITLAAVYLVGALVFFGIRALLRLAPTNAAIDGFLNRIPVIGKARRSFAMARFTKVYHACILAGIGMEETARTASDASHSGVIREAGETLVATAKRGDPLGPAFIASSSFPNAFARSYATAEQSGMLDKDLARWSAVYQSDSEQGAKDVATAVPKVLYALVVIFVVWKILGFYQGYYSAIDQIE